LLCRKDELAGLIRAELQTRCDDEGCPSQMLGEYRGRLEAVKEEASEYELEEIYRQVMNLRPLSLQPWEPSTLEEIREARPEGPRDLPVALSDDTIYDRIYGGWLGRAAGCALGKPVEGWTRQQIEAYLEFCGESDITGFFPYRDDQPDTLPRKMGKSCLPSCRENIQYMQRDDDTDYTVIGLHVLNRVGPDFRTGDVADVWLQKLPFHCTYTAERVAYKNIVAGLVPPETAYNRNPYRQWIGAQIRADAFGYVCPGQPEKAAGLAWRDACLSHVKNGIYGEMWVAAAIAAAFVERDVEKVIDIATSEIPAGSRFAAMVKDMKQWRRECPDWKTCWQRIKEKYGHLHPVHTINNAALVILGLLYGERDFGRTIGIAVQSGWDTDCNGATAGSILGVMLGAEALPGEWVKPFNDTLETAVFGYNYPKFSDLARETSRIALQNLE